MISWTPTTDGRNRSSHFQRSYQDDGRPRHFFTKIRVLWLLASREKAEPFHASISVRTIPVRHAGPLNTSDESDCITSECRNAMLGRAARQVFLSSSRHASKARSRLDRVAVYVHVIVSFSVRLSHGSCSKPRTGVCAPETPVCQEAPLPGWAVPDPR